MNTHFATGPGKTCCGIPIHDSDPGHRFASRDMVRFVLRDRFDVTCKRCAGVAAVMAAQTADGEPEVSRRVHWLDQQRLVAECGLDLARKRSVAFTRDPRKVTCARCRRYHKFRLALIDAERGTRAPAPVPPGSPIPTRGTRAKARRHEPMPPVRRWWD